MNTERTSLFYISNLAIEVKRFFDTQDIILEDEYLRRCKKIIYELYLLPDMQGERQKELEKIMFVLGFKKRFNVNTVFNYFKPFILKYNSIISIS